MNNCTIVAFLTYSLTISTDPLYTTIPIVSPMPRVLHTHAAYIMHIYKYKHISHADIFIFGRGYRGHIDVYIRPN